jgi:hypothetical protein
MPSPSPLGCASSPTRPERRLPFLRSPRLVDHQHRARVTQVLDQQGAHVVVVPNRSTGAAGPSGVAWPACSAIVQQFFRGRSASSPSTNARAWRLGSTRGNRRATRPITSSNSSCHRAGSTSTPWPAATVWSSAVSTAPDHRRWPPRCTHRPCPDQPGNELRLEYQVVRIVGSCVLLRGRWLVFLQRLGRVACRRRRDPQRLGRGRQPGWRHRSLVPARDGATLAQQATPP